jgi:circadian clock protein KaiC
MASTTYGNKMNSVVSTGIAGLDDILGGGYTPHCIYLVEGNPGSGKTTLGLQFLFDGVRKGEKVLYVTLSETRNELEMVAESHEWSLKQINIVELIPSEDNLKAESQYKMFHPSEVELGETTKKVLDEVQRISPTRIVFDSLSEMRLLAQNPLRYRRQILALKQFFTGRNCTVLLLDDKTAEITDLQLQSIAHGVVTLEQLAPDYGAERRRLRVTKMRGIHFRGGFHDFVIRRGGIEIFPRLIASEHATEFEYEDIKSGVPQLDQLLGGGLSKGTSTFIIGPAGSGKSTIAAQYAVAAAASGDAALFLTFDEGTDTLRKRMLGLGLDLETHLQSGRIKVRQVAPSEVSPGEFAQIIRKAIDNDHVKLLVIDSLNGYLNCMSEEKYVTIQLHELLSYLAQKGVTTLMVVAQIGVVGTSMPSPVDASYLADTVVLLRYYEAQGSIRKAISVVKKRTGYHENMIRDLHVSNKGIHVGEPLTRFQGILTGVPVYTGAPENSNGKTH